MAGLRLGDQGVFELAGAYSWNSSHYDFLMHLAPEFHYQDGEIQDGEIQDGVAG